MINVIGTLLFKCTQHFFLNQIIITPILKGLRLLFALMRQP
jgi:hypothetical protein